MEILIKLQIEQNEIISKTTQVIDKKESFLLTYFNVHCYYIYSKNKEYKRLIDNEFITYPDGTGLWIMLNKIGRKYPRFNATDLNYLLMNYLIENNKSVVIIGGNFEERDIKDICLERNLNLVRYFNGYIDNQFILNETQYVSADVILIGMGVPKQEVLAYEISKIQKSSVVICVGNFFEFYFGKQKRAPLFMQRIGLEWLYRLYLEPRRLFFRYTVENLYFFWKTLFIKK